MRNDFGGTKEKASDRGGASHQTQTAEVQEVTIYSAKQAESENLGPA